MRFIIIFECQNEHWRRYYMARNTSAWRYYTDEYGKAVRHRPKKICKLEKQTTSMDAHILNQLFQNLLFRSNCFEVLLNGLSQFSQTLPQFTDRTENERKNGSYLDMDQERNLYSSHRLLLQYWMIAMGGIEICSVACLWILWICQIWSVFSDYWNISILYLVQTKHSVRRDLWAVSMHWIMFWYVNSWDVEIAI